MEEDIKLLEEFLSLKTIDNKIVFTEKFLEVFKEPIRNLMARNKELEEVVKTYNAIPNYMGNDTKIVIADIDYFNDGILKENLIPKSKARKKIEEAKGKIEYYKKCANIAKDRVEKRLMCDQINELKTAIKYFEELLQEGDK